MNPPKVLAAIGAAVIVAGIVLLALVELIVDDGPRPSKPYDVALCLIAFGAVAVALGCRSRDQ